MRTITAACVLLLPLLGSSPATGSPPVSVHTCHGRVATIVGSGQLTGTAHDDVIVTSGGRVRTGAGDDLVCVVGDSSEASVSVGDGDDAVYVLSHVTQVTYRGESGSDTYVGNGQGDLVAFRADGSDTIRTRGGSDTVSVNAARGERRARVSLGGGDDLLWLHLSSVGRTVDGGAGRDRMVVDHKSTHRWLFDNRLGRATSGGEVRYRWRGFESFELEPLRAPTVEFRGSDAGETFITPGLGDPEVLATMGGGDDEVTVVAPGHGQVDGGDGRDRLTFRRVVQNSPDFVTADLASGLAQVGNQGIVDVWGLAAVEDLDAAHWPRAELQGDDAANVLRATGSCAALLDGRGGNDTVDGGTFPCADALFGATPGGGTFLGGDGDDVLTGTVFDDQLDGGPGTDSADGREGHDTCAAEVRVSCELP